MTGNLSMRISRAVGIVVVLLLAGGCDSTPPRAVVKGKVTLGDKPLTFGNVMFWSKTTDKVTASATIDKDGNYVMNDAPVGEAMIAVTVPDLPPGALEAMKQMKNSDVAKKTPQSVDPNDPSKKIQLLADVPDNIVPIPKKYSIPADSGLVYTVKNGEQTYDIKLTP
jgi:hypothetical protein